MSLTSNYTTEKLFSFLNGSSKKRTSISKKRIRKKILKRKEYWTSLKAFLLGKSLSTGNSKSFFVQQNK